MTAWRSEDDFLTVQQITARALDLLSGAFGMPTRTQRAVFARFDRCCHGKR